MNITKLPFVILAVSTLWLGPVNLAVYGQSWLNDQSYRPMQDRGSAPFPTVPSDALLVPPPPLEELPPSVFEELKAPTPLIVEKESVQTIWYYPWTWIPRNGWKNSAELGINGSSGNTETLSFQTGARFKRKTEFSLFDFTTSYNKKQNNGRETQNNALVSTNFERFLGQTPWTYFVKQGLEYDEFKAFNVRYNFNSGFGYGFIRRDDLTLVGRIGAGASREIGGPDNAWKPEALFGTDYEHQVTNRTKLIAKVDYFPEFSNFSKFRLVSDLAIEYLFDEKGNLSLKLGANDRYDSTPNGRLPNDVNYSMLLLYKF